MGLGLNNVDGDFLILGRSKLKVTIDFLAAAWNTVGTHEVFDVTGVVLASVFFDVTKNCTSGGAGTLAIEDDQGSVWSAAQAVGNLTTTRLILPAGTVTTSSIMKNFFEDRGWNVLKSSDFGFRIAAAAFTDGTIDAYCLWTPISDGATVVAGAGGAL